MAMLSDAKRLFDQWIVAVTAAIDAATSRIIRARRILLEENADGGFTATMVAGKNGETLAAFLFRLDGGQPQPPLPPPWQAAFRGSRVETKLQARHVMVRLLDFPGRAGEFLDGMIRSQIDRLTPWNVTDAIYGRSIPIPIAQDRIEVVFAATSKLRAAPLVQLATALDVASVAISTTVEGSDGASQRVILYDEVLAGVIGLSTRLPRLLRAMLLGFGLAAAVALLSASYLGASLQSEREDLQHRIALRSAALRPDAGAANSALSARAKQTTPSTVIVLETLSRLLPDATYVTELHIDGDKIQLIGMTQDAPALIRLIEQSQQFTQATFFAPTTRAAGEAAERFHIEAHINAFFGTST